EHPELRRCGWLPAGPVSRGPHTRPLRCTPCCSQDADCPPHPALSSASLVDPTVYRPPQSPPQRTPLYSLISPWRAHACEQAVRALGRRGGCIEEKDRRAFGRKSACFGEK